MGAEQDLRTNGHEDSGDLKRDIDRTRSRMDETIDALAAKLQPRNLVQEAIGWAGYDKRKAEQSTSATANDFVKEVAADLLHSFRGQAKDLTVAGVKRAGTGTLSMAKCHPIPAALIASGLAWLAYEGSCGLRGKAYRKGWKTYNPNPEYGGSYVDARTGLAYSDTPSYGAGTTGSVSATHAARAPRPQPEPSYGGSYVDARTGQPYNSSTYGQEATMQQDRSNQQSSSGQIESYSSDAGVTGMSGAPGTESCPPYKTSIGGGQSQHASSGSTGGVSSYVSSASSAVGGAVSGAAGSVSNAASGVAGSIRGAGSTVADGARSGVSSVTGAARTGVSSLTGAARAAAHSTTQGISTVGESLRTGVHSTTHSLGHGAQNATQAVREGYHYSRDRFDRALHEYPLAVGAAALGAGLVLGLLLPRTEKENELLGDRADQLKERARRASQEAIERGKRVARETANAVREEVDAQGLTPSRLKESVRGIASGAAECATGNVQDSGLTLDSLKDKAQHVLERAQQTAKREAFGNGGQAGEGEEAREGSQEQTSV